MNSSKFGSILGTVGVAAGIIYGIKKNSGFTKTAIFAALFGISGTLLGNAISKFYEY